MKGWVTEQRERSVTTLSENEEREKKGEEKERTRNGGGEKCVQIQFHDRGRDCTAGLCRTYSDKGELTAQSGCRNRRVKGGGEGASIMQKEG